MVTAQEKKQGLMVMGLASKYAYDQKHAAFVEQTSLKIFDALKKIHTLGHAERLLLSHASLLHDIGCFISEKKHNKHGKYIIEVDKELLEYPEREKNLLSLIVYNHRKKLHKDTLLLPKKDRELVLKLSAILRVADALDYTREEVVTKNVFLEDPKVKITLEGVLPERLIGKLTEKKSLFNEIFKLDVSLHI